MSPRFLPVRNRLSGSSRAKFKNVCLQCRLHSILTSQRARQAPPTASFSQPRRFASNDDFEGSFADRLRKKIWGTDNPPGQKNPYVRESPEELEDRLLEEEERASRQRELDEIRSLGRPTPEEEQLGEPLEEASTPEQEAESEAESSYEYAPAKTWRHLRHIPNFEATEHSNRPLFEGFLASEKVSAPADVERAIKQALVEVWTLKQIGASPIIPTNVIPLSDDSLRQLAADSRFKIADSGDHELELDDEDLRETILGSFGRTSTGESIDARDRKLEESQEELLRVDEKYISGPMPYISAEEAIPNEEVSDDLEPASDAEEIVLTAENPEEAVSDTVVDATTAQTLPESGQEDAPRDQSWLRVSISNPTIKFAVTKRVMQLTGCRIPDSTIGRLKYAEDLIQPLLKPLKPPKFASTLLENETLLSLPNVDFRSERLSAMEKEEKIGRAKLIREALAASNLPIDMKQVRYKKKP